MNILILILGLLAAFGPLSIDMYLPALPEIAKDFGAPLSSVQLSLASFFVGIAIGQIFYGPFTDRFGRKRPLYIGLALYGIASFLCATTSQVEGLILFRFLQALGSCAGVVISRAIVRDMYKPHESAKIYSLIMLIMGVAPILAPILGGFLTHVAGWRSIFWILTALSFITMAAIAVFLKETNGPDESVKFTRTFHVYLEVLKDQTFLAFTIPLSFVYAGMFAYITGSPFVFIEYFKFSPADYSILFGVNAFGLILFSQINARLLRKFSPDQIITKTLPVTALAGLVLFLTGVYHLPVWVICPFLFIFILTMGLIAPNAAACALANQKKSAGSASALMGTIQFTISALCSSLVSKLHNGTVMPMMSVMFGCSLIAVILFMILKKNSATSEISSLS